MLREMECDDQEIPKLMLFADLRLSPENPGRLTPPLHCMATVPFRWEERPGKPIAVGDINNNKLAVSKSLELPPRLVSFISSAGKSGSKVINLIPSPDTVLDNPYIINSTDKAASFRFLADASPDDQEYKGKSLFGSSSKGRSISRRRSSSFSFSNPDCSTSMAPLVDKIKRGRSLVSSSQNHFWVRFCGGLRQLIMPWTRKQETNGLRGILNSQFQQLISGLIRAVEDVFPSSFLRFCTRHLYANLKKDIPGSGIKEIFWSCTRATNQYEFECAMQWMQKTSAEAYAWLMEKPQIQWSRHAYDTSSKSEHRTNNMTESFNSELRLIRRMDPLKLVNELRR